MSDELSWRIIVQFDTLELLLIDTLCDTKVYSLSVALIGIRRPLFGFVTSSIFKVQIVINTCEDYTYQHCCGEPLVSPLLTRDGMYTVSKPPSSVRSEGLLDESDSR